MNICDLELLLIRVINISIPCWQKVCLRPRWLRMLMSKPADRDDIRRPSSDLVAAVTCSMLMEPRSQKTQAHLCEGASGCWRERSGAERAPLAPDQSLLAPFHCCCRRGLGERLLMIPRLIAAFVRVFLCADVMASILMGFVWRGVWENPDGCWSASVRAGPQKTLQTVKKQTCFLANGYFSRATVPGRCSLHL